MVRIDRLRLEEAAGPWQEVLAGACRREVLQTLQWACFEQTVNGAEPSVLIARRGGEVIGGQVVLRRRVLRALHGLEAPGGPLFRDGCAAEVCEAVARYLEHGMGAALYRAMRPQAPHQLDGVLQRCGYQASPLHTILVGLSRPEEDLWRALDGNARTGVRKGQKAGVSVVAATAREQWQAFAEVHWAHCRGKGTVPLSQAALEHLQDHLLPAGLCRLLLGMLAGRCVSGMLFLAHGDTMLLYAAASDQRFLDASPNDLLMWEAMRWGSRQGLRWLDLHDTDPREGSPLYGLHRFKSKWGGELVDRPFYVRGRGYLWLREQLRGNGAWRRVANALRARRLA